MLFRAHICGNNAGYGLAAKIECCEPELFCIWQKLIAQVDESQAETSL